MRGMTLARVNPCRSNCCCFRAVVDNNMDVYLKSASSFSCGFVPALSTTKVTKCSDCELFSELLLDQLIFVPGPSKLFGI